MGTEEPTTTNNVTVLFFATAREAAGTDRACLEPAGPTVGQLLDQLGASYGPALERLLGACGVWVNLLPAERGTVLHAGDEVAVLPPVSGG
jgi:molybdopterin converting factor small subunit